jgi:predicted nucleic acid-binding Zn ribbon protein
MAVFVLRGAFEHLPFAELITDALVQQALILSIVIIIAGIVAKAVEKGHKVVSKNRCKVCGKPVTPGMIYCREHLRGVLDLEDRRTHNTRIR